MLLKMNSVSENLEKQNNNIKRNNIKIASLELYKRIQDMIKANPKILPPMIIESAKKQEEVVTWVDNEPKNEMYMKGFFPYDIIKYAKNR